MLDIVPVRECVVRCCVFGLQVSDQLVEINGDSTAGMTHSQAVEQIRRVGRRIHLVLKRGNGYVPDYGEDEGMVCRINYRLGCLTSTLSALLVFLTSAVLLDFLPLNVPSLSGFPLFPNTFSSLSLSQWSSPACLSV